MHLTYKYGLLPTRALVMDGEFGGEATHTVAEAMQERYEAFRKVKGGADD